MTENHSAANRRLPEMPTDHSIVLRAEDFLKVGAGERGRLVRAGHELDKQALLTPLKEVHFNRKVRALLKFLMQEEVRIVSTAKVTTGRYLIARAKPKPEELWLSVPQAAAYAGIRPAALYKQIQRGKVEAAKLPGRGLCVDALKLRRF